MATGSPTIVSAFIRGDLNLDFSVDVGDSSLLLSFLFQNNPLPCLSAADLTRDNVIDLGDFACLAEFSFQAAHLQAPHILIAGIQSQPFPVRIDPVPDFPPPVTPSLPFFPATRSDFSIFPDVGLRSMHWTKGKTMETSLNGKSALVCGSSQGIGLASAVELASLGARVTLCARNEADLTKAVTDLPEQVMTFLLPTSMILNSSNKG